jgi:spore germination cell wall hydrolase CwlJ-like protein
MRAKKEGRIRFMPCPGLDDITLIALTVWGEARGESYVGMLAVAWVICNRMDQYGETVSGVVLKAYQFSFWNTEDPSRPTISEIDFDNSPWLDCYKAASAAYFELSADPTAGATMYLNPAAASPDWDYSKLKKTATIGNHVFYEELQTA